MTLKFEIGARIRFVRLGGEVRGHFSKKRPWCADQKRAKLLGNRRTGGLELLELDNLL